MGAESDRFESRRHEMVGRQIEGRGVKSEPVLEAMRTVPREAFVPGSYEKMAYRDRPLPIGEGQTISQPYIVAMMAEAAAVEPGDRVLEVGTGSGYGAAVLSRIGGEVYTIERHADLAEDAREVFRELGYDNIQVKVGDGTRGWPDAAPYDAILATAAGPEVPESFKEQLAVGGKIVMPVGEKLGGQRMTVVEKVADGEFEEEDLGFVRFVPLVGEEGFSSG